MIDGDAGLKSQEVVVMMAVVEVGAGAGAYSQHRNVFLLPDVGVIDRSKACL